MITYAAALVLVLLFLSSAVKILNEYERGVVFRLGRVIGCKGPGLILLIPAIDKMVRVDLRVVAMDVPAQDVITRDNVTIKVSAVLYFRVIDPNHAIVGVENYLYATSQLSQTTLRSVCGQAELDELLASREKINTHIQEILDKDTEPWGVKVAKVEIKNIDLPQEMQRAIAKQAEAERERRAKVIGGGRGIPGGPETFRRGEDHRREPDRPATALPPDTGGSGDRETLDDHLPGPDRPVDPLHADLEGHERHNPASRRQSPAGGRIRPRPVGQRRWRSSGCTRTMTFSPTPIRKLNAK